MFLLLAGYLVASSSALLSVMLHMARCIDSLDFLAFPGEIRNKIYRLVLLHHPLRAVAHSPTPPAGLAPPLALRPPQTLSITTALLYVNRQIHEEASGILYGENLFYSHPRLLSGLPFLLKQRSPVISSGMVSLIRGYHLNVRLDCDPFYTEKQLEEAFNGVELLEIETSESEYMSSDYHVLKLFTGIRSVKKARVYGCVAEVWARALEKAMESAPGEAGPCFPSISNALGQAMECDVWVRGAR